MSPSVVTITRAELERRRSEVLADLGLSIEEFRRLAETRTLTGEEWDAREELDQIEFLLGSDSR